MGGLLACPFGGVSNTGCEVLKRRGSGCTHVSWKCGLGCRKQAVGYQKDVAVGTHAWVGNGFECEAGGSKREGKGLNVRLEGQT